MWPVPAHLVMEVCHSLAGDGVVELGRLGMFHVVVAPVVSVSVLVAIWVLGDQRWMEVCWQEML